MIADSALAFDLSAGLDLLVLALLLVSAALHEWGHVTACRYGGVKPGVMGFSLYLVWPAFYSTATDSYRLSRVGGYQPTWEACTSTRFPHRVPGYQGTVAIGGHRRAAYRDRHPVPAGRNGTSGSVSSAHPVVRGSAADVCPWSTPLISPQSSWSRPRTCALRRRLVLAQAGITCDHDGSHDRSRFVASGLLVLGALICRNGHHVDSATTKQAGRPTERRDRGGPPRSAPPLRRQL